MNYIVSVDSNENIVSVGSTSSNTLAPNQFNITSQVYNEIMKQPVGWKWILGAPVAPAPVSNINQLANQQMAQIQAAFTAANGANIAFTNGEGVTETFSTAYPAQHLIVETLMAFQGDTTTFFPWLAIDGTSVEMTLQDLQNLLRTGGQRNLSNLRQFNALMAQIQTGLSTGNQTLILSAVWVA